jgi:hypothetical protein
LFRNIIKPTPATRVDGFDLPSRDILALWVKKQKETDMLTERFDEAFRYAHRLHRAQTRKGTFIPYVSHLMSVAALVIEHGGNEDQAIAALLHDAAEDQGGAKTLARIRKTFGDPVADIVSDCTDAWTEQKQAWRQRKEAYVASLPDKPIRSLLVSLADKTHNAEAILFDYRVLGDQLWTRFEGGAGGTRWYYDALTEVFKDKMPGALADRLWRATAAFQSDSASSQGNNFEVQ